MTHDTRGWHDTITGHATAGHVAARWGAVSYQEARNDWRRSARDGLLVELTKHGLGARDLAATVNLFSKVTVDGDGRLAFCPGNSPAGARVVLRADTDLLVLLNTAPHPLDRAAGWSPKPVAMSVREVGVAAPDDPVRTACPENERGFAAADAWTEHR